MQSPQRKLNSILKELPDEKKREVVNFAEYLQYQQVEEQGLTSQVIESLKQVKVKKVRPARSLLPS